MITLKNSILLGLLASLFACTQSPPQEVRMEERKTAKGALYSLFYPQGLSIQVVTSRPDAANRRFQLSVAAAYTDLETNRPLDLLVCNSTVLQPQAKVGFLDGALTIIGDTLTIAPIPKGQSPSRSDIEKVRRRKGTLLLQELLVFQGKNQRPGAGNVFQRRALVEFAGHRFAVVESASNYTMMKQFADDLIELGAQNALYLDMGDWDEGWYKVNGHVAKLGNRRTETARQSNWLVFAQPASTE